MFLSPAHLVWKSICSWSNCYWYEGSNFEIFPTPRVLPPWQPLVKSNPIWKPAARYGIADLSKVVRTAPHCSNDYCGLIRLWPPIWSQAGEFANKSRHRTLFCSSHQLAFIALQSLAPALALQPRDNLMYIITDTKAKSVVKCCRTLKIHRGYWNYGFVIYIIYNGLEI